MGWYLHPERLATEMVADMMLGARFPDQHPFYSALMDFGTALSVFAVLVGVVVLCLIIIKMAGDK